MPIFEFKDIIQPGNPFQDVLKYLEILDKQANETITKMIALEKSIKAINRTGSGGEAKLIIENTEKLATETKKLTDIQKAELAMKLAIEKANAKLIVSQSKEALELEKVNAKIKEQNISNKEQLGIKQKEIGAYKELSVQLNKLRTDYKNLAAENKHNTDEGKKLLSQIGQLDAKLKHIDSSVGQYQRNVGNYTSVWQKFGHTLRDFFIGGGIIFAIQRVSQALFNFGKGSISEAEQAAKSFAKVEQAILSTGQAAGFTANELKKIDDNLELATNIDADQIMNDVTAQLLTFTKLQGEEFKRAQKAAIDLATVLGGGGELNLKSVSIQLGKAMQDPIKGITALRKSGVSFSESQQDVIKALVKTGKVAEAQRLILLELEKQYGGQAEAATKAGLGPLQRLGIQWDNFKEMVGNGLIPIINKIAEAIGPALDAMINFFKVSTAYIVDFINGWIELYNDSILFRSVIETISIAFSVAWQSIKLFFNLTADGFALLGRVIGYTFNPKNWGVGFSEGLNKIFKQNFETANNDVFNYGKGVAESFKEGAKSVIKGKATLLEFSTASTNKVKTITENQDIDKPQTDKQKKEAEKIRKEKEEYLLWKSKDDAARNKFLDEQDKLAITEEEKYYTDLAQSKMDADQAVWDFKLADYERQKELEEQKLEEEKERLEERKAIITEAATVIGEQLGNLAAEGKLTLKEFGKSILLMSLDLLKNKLILLQVEILGEALKAGPIRGIIKSAISISLLQAAFSIAKAKISSFAKGTEYLTGEKNGDTGGTLIEAHEGERIVPRHINAQLMGLKNKELPRIIQNGLNTERLEALLEENKKYSSMIAFYVSHGKNIHTDREGFLTVEKWDTGEVNRIK